jgi:hypothetical protein
MTNRSDDQPSRPVHRVRASQAERQKLEPSGFVDKRTDFMALPRVPQAPAAFDTADIGAFKALARGEAMAHQQMRAIEWLLYMTGAYNDTYVPGDSYASAYAMGKRSAGLQIVKLLNIQMAKPEGQEGEHG